mgnify:CR=1 FL=1
MTASWLQQMGFPRVRVLRHTENQGVGGAVITFTDCRVPKENLMGELTVTCFITLDNVVEDPHLWSGKFQSDDTGEYNDAVLLMQNTVLTSSEGNITFNNFVDAFDNALAQMGCPDHRIDRFCITCCSSSQPSHHAGLPA